MTLEEKLGKEKKRNHQLCKLIKSSRADLKALRGISHNLKDQLTKLAVQKEHEKENQATNLKPEPIIDQLNSQNIALADTNKQYQNKLEQTVQCMEDYQEEINKSIFELDLYKNQVSRLTHLTKNQERVINYLNQSQVHSSNNDVGPYGSENQPSESQLEISSPDNELTSQIEIDQTENIEHADYPLQPSFTPSHIQVYSDEHRIEGNEIESNYDQ